MMKRMMKGYVVAASLLFAMAIGMAKAQTPAGSQWKMTFDEECNGTSMDWSKWSSEQGVPNPSSKILATRWPENVVMKDGICYLVTRKQELSKGKPWTSASIWTKSFRQKYGYFEARIRTNNASGLNNAFWLDTVRSETDPKKNFELDICEVHYPNILLTTMHDWTTSVDQSEQKKSIFDAALSDNFHVYGMEWDEQKIVWYLDGKELWTIKNRKANGPVRVLLSTMVMPWAGEVTDALDKTAMQVDWVRVYEKKSAQ